MIKNTLKNNTALSISEFDYTLPNEKIAKYPLGKRDNSKLLIYKDGIIKDSLFSSLSDQLTENDLLVVNNTKVIHSRLLFKKVTGAIIEIFCLEPHLPSDYVLSLQSNQKCQWKCLVGNLKRWKEGVLTQHFFISGIGDISLTAKKIESFENYLTIEFTWNSLVPFAQLLEQFGETPIPPYLNRSSENIDKERYQTVYSNIEGSVAAPTAGLHFTEGVLETLKAKPIQISEVTLHVGAGTFKPVQTELVMEHEMHSEFFEVTRETLINLLKAPRIIPVGTTSLRTLESLYWLALKIKKGLVKPHEIPELEQWDAYKLEDNLDYRNALEIILEYIENHKYAKFSAKTKLMILPGYQIKSSKALITNFHQPKSTLLVLVSSFLGEDWKKIYNHALENNYRFLSYGDSSLLFHNLHA